MFVPTIEDRARERGINQFTGVLMNTLKTRLANLVADLKAIDDADEGGSIDGREWRLDAIADLEKEIERRTIKKMAQGPMAE